MKTDLTAKKIQNALKMAIGLAVTEELPQYLTGDGKILPGIREDGQILTRKEMAELSGGEALCCRMLFVKQCAASQQIVQKMA